MSKYIIVLGNGVEISEDQLDELCTDSYRTSDGYLIAVESDLTAAALSEKFLAKKKQGPGEEQVTHLVCRVAGGSYFGFHDNDLWEFLARKK